MPTDWSEFEPVETTSVATAPRKPVDWSEFEAEESSPLDTSKFNPPNSAPRGYSFLGGLPDDAGSAQDLINIGRGALALPGKAAVAVADIPTRMRNYLKDASDPNNPAHAATLAERSEAGPIVKLPRIEESPYDSKAAQIGTGLYNTASQTLEGLIQPESTFTLALIPGEGAISKAAAIAFGSGQLAELPSQISDAITVLNDPKATLTDKTKAVANPGVSTLLGGIMVKHGLADTPLTAPARTGADWKLPADVTPGIKLNQVLTEKGPANAETIRKGAGQLQSQGSPVEAVKEVGGDVGDPKAILDKVAQLEADLERWQSWWNHNDLRVKVNPEEPVPAPPVAAPATPILRPGEKSTGDLFQGQDQPFNLAGETGTDAERIAKAKTDAEKSAAEAKALQDKQQGQLVGMGGAVPSEFEQTPQTPTGIKNATVDAERAKRGLPPVAAVARKANPELWDAAMARIDRDPGVQDRLIAELAEKPRALTDEEDALLLHRQIDLHNEYGKATRDLAQAYDDGRTDAVEREKTRVNLLSDQLKELYDVGRAAGTETGRGLQARKMMAYEDFSLAQMEMDMRASKGGRQLTDAERTELNEAHKKISELLAKQAEAESGHAARSKAFEDEINRLKSEVAKQPKYSKPILDMAQKIADSVRSQAEAARARIKAREGTVTFGSGPLHELPNIRDYAIIGAEYISQGIVDAAVFADKLVSEFGEKIRPFADKILSAANEEWNKIHTSIAGTNAEKTKRAVRRPKGAAVERKAEIVENLKEAPDDKNLLSNTARELARGEIEAGNTDREKILDAVHETLRQANPELSRREVADAISLYGKFKPLSKDAASIRLREISTELQAISKLEDIESGKPPLKTGLERQPPTDEARRLNKQVNEAKKKYGIVTTDPARQLKSSLDAIRTRLVNAINDVQHEIATRTKIVREKGAPPSTPEIESLRKQLADLREQKNQIFGSPKFTDAQRVKLAMSAVEKSIADLETRIKNRDIGPRSRGRSTPNTPELEAARAKRDALSEQFQELRDLANPGRTPEQIALQRAKTAAKNSEANYRDRIARNDFDPKPRTPIVPDAELTSARAAAERAKLDWRKARQADEIKNRSITDRFINAVIAVSRASILSSPTIFLKLGAAAALRAGSIPLEVISGALSKTIPAVRRIAEQAPSEGKMSPKAISAAIKSVRQGLQDAWSTIKTGESDLTHAYGDPLKYRTLPGKFHAALAIPGRIHAAIKAPIKRAAFEMSYVNRALHAEARGADLTDPIQQIKIGKEAYVDANRAIFQDRNEIAQRISAFERRFKNKSTGEETATSQVVRTATGIGIPIRTVPANIVAEAFNYIGGLIPGGVKVVKSLREGAADLTPDQADQIMRHLQKGAIGPAVLLLGWYAYNSSGGFYQPGKKQKPGQLKAGDVKVGNVTIPQNLLHHPIMQVFQAGATMHQVAEQTVKGQKKGAGSGALAGAVGLVEEAPIVRETFDFGQLHDPNRRDTFMADWVRSRVIPQAVQWEARREDVDSKGKPIKRKPTTLIQNLETGIPGLRRTVPKAPSQP